MGFVLCISLLHKSFESCENANCVLNSSDVHRLIGDRWTHIKNDYTNPLLHLCRRELMKAKHVLKHLMTKLRLGSMQ